MNQNLKRILLCAALIGLPFTGVRALDWVPVGDGVDENGFATNAGVYEGGDYIGDDSPNSPDFNIPTNAETIEVYGTLYYDTAPSLGGTQVLDGYEAPTPCSLKINGNVVVDATANNVTMNINEDVVIEPYFTPPSDEYATGPEAAGCSQLYFNTGEGFTTTVNVMHNLEFRGLTNEPGDYQDLLVTFAGRGSVIFNMSDGTSIKFNGAVDNSSPMALNDPATNEYETCPQPSNAAGGCKVFILMDQTVDDPGKVKFQRANPTLEEAQRCLIEVGPNSLITYLSTDPSGAVAEDGTGYGTMTFDPTCAGTGRMILLIRGAYLLDLEQYTNPGEETLIANDSYGKMIEKYPFNDGAVVIAGHYVSDFAPDAISGCILPAEGEGSGAGYDFSVPAGYRAKMHIVKNTTTGETPVDNARGLLIVNDVVNHGKLASDPYWDLYTSAADGYAGVSWAYSNPDNALNNVRRGYVVGINGYLEVANAAFADYVAGGTNFADPLAWCDFAEETTGGDPTSIKKRNPAAFIVDGLDPDLFWSESGNPFLDFALSAFDAANPWLSATPTQAQVQLNASGKLFLRACGSTQFGYLNNLFGPGRYTGDYDSPENDPALDWTSSLAVLPPADSETGEFQISTYDGYLLSPNDDTVQSGEGEHVLDVEGSVRFTGGTVNAASLLLNHEGAEIFGATLADGFAAATYGTTFNRPLLADGTEYTRYNSPTLFFNNNATFVSCFFSHSDATKYVDGVPSFSEPAITGGERFYFAALVWGEDAVSLISDPNRYRMPELQFFGSEFQLHESCNASGVRFVVRDLADTSSNNTSTFRFYDHGDLLDTNLTGFGRIMMFGSSLNLMDDGSNSFATESCCLNVYKHNQPAEAFEDSSAVSLSLANGNEFHPDIQTAIDADATFASKQRAHHLMMFAQPPALDNAQPGDRAASCNMAIGWGPTQTIADTIGGVGAPAGDSWVFPGMFPYPEEPKVAPEDVNAETLPNSPFTLDANLVPPATVSIDGSYICFGSFDVAGNSIPVPVGTDNDDGVVYVKHGGKITTTQPAGTERTSVPFQSVFSTMLCQRIWNDYDPAGTARTTWLTGIVDLPHDQVTFEAPYGVQPYNFTQTMFGAVRNDVVVGEETIRSGDGGYVRLSFENEANRTLRRDRSGAEEVSIGWFYKDMADFSVSGNANMVKGKHVHGVNTKGAIARFNRSKSAMLKSLGRMTRATQSIGAPVDQPTDLLYIGPGDDIVQMKVYGATMSDPFILDISGDGARPNVARVREFVSAKSTRDQVVDRFISEGAHAVLFVEFGGRIGLGSRDWNENSVNAWNLLGKDYVTICPLGAGVIDVNSNLLITDRQALVAGAGGVSGTGFGNGQVDRLVFYAEHPYEIRIPAGGELDLSSFGQGTNRQEIAFAGKVKVIVEDGATIRFPDSSSVVGGVVLYFNDSAQLVFEGRKEGSVFLPHSDAFNAAAAVQPAPLSEARTKIVGKGQIWLNKDAQMNVNGNTFVGVETDSLTQTTDLTISLVRQSQFFIGDDNLAGGAFQVGNPTDQEGATINFTLALNGPKALFHMDREGFFGLGAGVMNKSGKPNGDAALADNPVVGVDGFATVVDGAPVFTPDTDPTSGEWQIQALFNLNECKIEVRQGIFEHKNIVDGSDSSSALMAVGPATQYTFNLGNQDTAKVRGGGNIAFIPTTATTAAPVFANIWDYAGTWADGEAYNILSSGQLLLDKAAEFAGVNWPAATSAGKSFVFATTPAVDLFNLLSFKEFNLQSTKRVDYAATQFSTNVAYTTQTSTIYDPTELDGAEIVRAPSPSVVPGGGSLAEALDMGALLAAGEDVPTSYSIGK